MTNEPVQLTAEQVEALFDRASRVVEIIFVNWTKKHGLPPQPLAQAMMSYAATLIAQVDGFRAVSEQLQEIASALAELDEFQNNTVGPRH